MTSWMESLPMSILEAAAMGVPTIAFDCSPGVRSLIGTERGWLVPPGDEAAYARGLARPFATRRNSLPEVTQPVCLGQRSCT